MFPGLQCPREDGDQQRYLKSDDSDSKEEDLLAEVFDLYLKQTVEAPVHIVQYINSHFHACLKIDVHM